MGTLPSFKRAREMSSALNKDREHTIACWHCKKPLWSVKIRGMYGTRVAADKEPFDGVPAYEAYWNKDQTPKRTDCPHCGHDYFKATKMPNGKFAAVPYVVEWQ